MTCWPRGRGGLPIRNRSFLARTGENRSQDSTTTESDWEPPPTPPAPPAPLRSPASSLETARAQWERRPEPRGAFCARRPMSRCPSPGPSPRWRLPAPSREPRASRAALGSPVAAFAVPEAAVLYLNKKGNATTFLFRVFSQIYRIIAFICLFIL